MTSPEHTIERTSFPWHRRCPYAPPEEYAHLRAHEPVAKVTLATGIEAWLVTRYEHVRQVLNDPRFSSDRAHPNFPYFMPVPQEFRTNASFLGMDPPEHTKHRKMINAEFTYRRVQTMRPRVQQIVDDCLSAMIAGGPPADLMQALALPVPTAVICELLGVPQADQFSFHERTKLIVGGTSTAEDRMRGIREMEGYLRDLVVDKQHQPGEDLLSRLVVKYTEAGMFDLAELVSAARLLLNAGHESSANMIALGTLTLLQHPDQLDMLRADPALAAGAAEELLRYLAVADLATARVAAVDVELGGVQIRAGEGVLALGAAANRDPDTFADPDRFDIRRHARQHVSFGYGQHYCIGADLTRVELELVFGTLFQRLPGLHLTKPADQLSYKNGALLYGVYELPVGW